MNRDTFIGLMFIAMLASGLYSAFQIGWRFGHKAGMEQRREGGKDGD